MIDDENPPDEMARRRDQSRTGGGGQGRGKPARAGSGDDVDEAMFHRIMQVLRNIERQTGSVPTLLMLAEETGISLHKVRGVLLKFLPELADEGTTQFPISLKALLFGNGEDGLMSPKDWSHVRSEHESTGEPISFIISRLGLASESQLKNALELQYGVNYLSLAGIDTPDPECLTLLPEALMREHQLVPVGKRGACITIAMVNPNNLAALDAIKMRLKGMQVKLSVCTEVDFQSFMDSVYSRHLNSPSPSNDSEAPL
jgi:hypothetical protein